MQVVVYRYVIKPDGNFRIAWDMTGLLLIIYIIFTIPVEAIFDNIVIITWMNNLMVVFFFVDILLNFNTAYFDEEYTLVTSRCFHLNAGMTRECSPKYP